jgi:hypothetical protein
MADLIKKALIGIGIAATAAAIIAALFAIFMGEPPLVIIPYYRACSSETQCTADAPECADCLDCHETLGRCVYSLNDSPGCACVAGEQMPCERFFIPGVKTCLREGKLSTKWSGCALFP